MAAITLSAWNAKTAREKDAHIATEAYGASAGDISANNYLYYTTDQYSADQFVQDTMSVSATAIQKYFDYLRDAARLNNPQSPGYENWFQHWRFDKALPVEKCKAAAIAYGIVTV